MKKTAGRILAVLIILNLFLACSINAYAGDDAAEASAASLYANVKIYSEDSSHGKVVGGGVLTVDADASITALGNRINISGVKNSIYAVPNDGYVFNGWDNVPENHRVNEESVILAKFKPVGLDTVSKVTASVAGGSKGMGTLIPTSSVTVLTNAEIKTMGSTVLIAKDGFSAIPESGKVFSHWEGIPEDGIIHEDTAIEAVFEAPEDPVTVSFVVPATGGDYVCTTGSTEIVVPAGAQITSKDAQICLAGTEYVLAVPFSDYEFVQWSGIPEDGRIAENTSITASFRPVVADETATTKQYSKTSGEEFNTDSKYGTMDEPVSDGLWIRDNDDTWSYDWHVPMANTWGCIENPYANENQPGHGWFYFDKTGQMQTGWRLIDDKWYYFEPVSNGCRGQLYAGASTSDGKEATASEADAKE